MAQAAGALAGRAGLYSSSALACRASVAATRLRLPGEPLRSCGPWGRAGLLRLTASSASSSSSCTEAERRYEEFRRTLQEPEDIWVRGSEARRKFLLTREDLRQLHESCILKESPYEARQRPFRQYPLKAVVELAKEKHGEEGLLRHYESYVSRHVDGDLSDKLYGNFGKKYWYDAPSTSTTEGRQSVLQGLKTNVGICTAKGVVWYATGSHAMFADWMHSIADVANYAYRLVELNRSARQRDFSHPYGYAPLRYITADRSFVFLFFVGGIYPLISAIKELAEASGAPCGPCEMLIAPAAVFVLSAALESVAVRAACREILSQCEKERVGPTPGLAARWPVAGQLQIVLQYLRDGRDVMSTATFTESSSGVLGACVGLVGLGASWYLQSAVPDIAASLLMASMICGVSGFLLRKSGTALLGQTLPGWRTKALVSRLEAHAAVVGVYDVKTEMVGTDTVRFKAEVQFNPQAITERVLQAGSLRGQQHPPETQELCGLAAHAVLKARLQEILPHLRHGLPAARGVDMEDTAAAWLYRNNGLFYEALAWELKDVERVLREELRDFRNVHIDLEPW